MKNSVLFIIWLIVVLSACQENKTEITDSQNISISFDSNDATNNFYDNAEEFNLDASDIFVEGEISNPYKVDFSNIPLRSVIVKETLLSDRGDKFVGAYRYDGYSLYDILNLANLNKKNAEEFKPIIDLYIEISNDNGEKVNVSWGEIYYPNHLHEIIVATKVMRIVPSKTNELWELPTKSKLVIASDLITERNISKPSKIKVLSLDKSFKVNKGMKPMHSENCSIFLHGEKAKTISSEISEMRNETFHTIFYGRGRGIHSTQPFSGVLLKSILSDFTENNKNSLQSGIITISAVDGYRVAFTFSEVFNRNDQSEVLLICEPESDDGGIFRIFPACDFFSDRAVKAVNEIHIDY